MMSDDGYFIKAEQLQNVMSDIEEVFKKYNLRKLEREVVLDILRDLEKKKAILQLQKKTFEKLPDMTKLLFQNKN